MLESPQLTPDPVEEQQLYSKLLMMELLSTELSDLKYRECIPKLQQHYFW